MSVGIQLHGKIGSWAELVWRSAMLERDLAICGVFVCQSVCHTPALAQNQ